MDKISLTASMRSNLLSLQNISGQVDLTQNKLSTGKKVNSAIDNPGSYYTALSLNNRADDLNALLDSMGQAVSTIKAATTALESATDFLEQASAVATQALETAKVPDKSFFEEKVGANGAVVTTAQELRDAIKNNKDVICVYGQITLDDIDTNGGLELKENQKLVGIGYFGNYDTDTDKFSSISATSNVAQNLISITKNGCEVSDLSINYVNKDPSGRLHAICVSGTGINANIGNVDINANFADTPESKAAICSLTGAIVNLKNNINTRISGHAGNGIFAYTNATININSGAEISIKTSGEQGHAIISHTNAAINVNSGAKIDIQTSNQCGYGIFASNAEINIDSGTEINIKTLGVQGYGIISYANAAININLGAEISIETSAQGSHGILAYDFSTCNIAGNIYIKTGNAYGLVLSNTSGNTVNILSTAQIFFEVNSLDIFNGYNGGGGTNVLNISQGAKLAFEKDDKINWYEVKDNWNDKNTSTTINNTITASDIKDKLNIEETSAWELPDKIEENNKTDEATGGDYSEASKQYQGILSQYDALIKDASYRGINLLQTDKLSVKFNEDNTASLDVQGKDVSSQALGLTVFDWQTQADIANSLAEIASALKSIRNYSAELGNNYSIITTRQDFTESLINVLTEGADKLTLADMNEESANMLALQTRQQLAINSLSLASQASQSILKLF